MSLSMKVIVIAFTWFFIAIIIFLSTNTFIIGEAVPIFDDIANTTDFVNYTTYQTRANSFVSVYYIVMGIMIISPVAFLIVYLLLKREPAPYEAGYGAY